MNRTAGQSTRVLAWAALLTGSLLPSAQAGEPMVSVRGGHTLALSADGKVLAWGSDQNGQLGTGTRPFETRPGLVVGLSNVQAIASGGYFSLALLRDGTVWTWGTNGAGQMGDGSRPDRAVPGKVPGLDNVREVCAGPEYGLALRADGSVWGWGSSYYLTLGDGPRPDNGTVAPVAGLQGVTAIACGDRHALALKADGTVLAWGRNEFGALGLGHTTDQARPTAVPGLSNVRALAAAQELSMALRADGTVWEWGASSPFVSPRPPARLSPVQVPGISGAAQITAGSVFGVAIAADKTRWWQWVGGEAAREQAPVGTLNGAARAYGQGFLLKADGTALGYGALNGNGFGNLGDGTVTYREEPAPVVDIAGLVQVASGTWYGMALGANGRVYSWGLDSSGQLGRGRFLHRSVPGGVEGLPAITQVSAGWDHSMALDAAGNLWGWGGNGYAQLGIGTWADVGRPERLSTINEVRAVRAGIFHTLALKKDGSVWGWGSVLPLPQDGDPTQPARLAEGAAAFAAGDSHLLLLRPDGTVAALGDNANGQLGDGSLDKRSAPVPVTGLSGVVALAASGRSSWALKADGSVWAWGENDRGQLGDGTLTQRLRPQVVPGLSGVVELTVGSQHALARRADGSLLGWFWGYEVYGELGSAQDQLGNTPRLLRGASNVASMVAGASVSGFVLQDGLVLMGGSNATGQLGDGSLANAMRPGFVLDESASAFLNLKRPGGSQPSNDPALVLLRAIRNTQGLTALLTDPRAMGVTGEVYFSALLPRTASPTVRAAGGARRKADAPVGMAPVVFTRSGIKQSGPSTAAQPSVAGALTAGTALPIYGNDVSDPLIGSNAIICVGVTIPELSAKGQVLMRPIASGDQQSGVTQCPTVQTAVTLQRYTGQSSGPITARTLTATIDPLAEDRGQVRRVYSWAVAPDGRQYMQTPAGWVAMTEPMQPAWTLTVPASGPLTLPVVTGMDLSSLVGTLVYIGLGSSWDEVRSFNKAGHYHTVQ